MSRPAYLDTSAVLRAICEDGTSPELERRLRSAPVLVVSRLAVVEASCAFRRLRARAAAGETRLSDAEREVERLWSRCEIWELTRSVCELARSVAPRTLVRTLDALHLATFVLARRRIEGIELLTADDRLRQAAETV